MMGAPVFEAVTETAFRLNDDLIDLNVLEARRILKATGANVHTINCLATQVISFYSAHWSTGMPIDVAKLQRDVQALQRALR